MLNILIKCWIKWFYQFDVSHCSTFNEIGQFHRVLTTNLHLIILRNYFAGDCKDYNYRGLPLFALSKTSNQNVLASVEMCTHDVRPYTHAIVYAVLHSTRTMQKVKLELFQYRHTHSIKHIRLGWFVNETKAFEARFSGHIELNG